MFFSSVKMGDMIVIVVERGDELRYFMPRALTQLEKDQEEGGTLSLSLSLSHTHTHTQTLAYAHFPSCHTNPYIYISELSYKSRSNSTSLYMRVSPDGMHATCSTSLV